MTLIVKTKSELKEAIDNKVSSFIVEGDLARKVKSTQLITKMSKISLALLASAIVAIVAAPATGGTSAAAGVALAEGVIVANSAAPAAVAYLAGPAAVAYSGGGASIVWGVVALGGITIILALFKNYNVKYTISPTEGLKAEFTRK